VLLAHLSARYDGLPNGIFPKEDTIASDLGWSVSTAKRAIGDAEDSGWLTVTRRKGRHNSYHLTTTAERAGVRCLEARAKWQAAQASVVEVVPDMAALPVSSQARSDPNAQVRSGLPHSSDLTSEPLEVSS
jgi:hypothetical protein